MYTGEDGNTLGFQASSSVTLANNWDTSTKSYFGTSSISSKTFSGSLQELRYYTVALSESSFNDYVMNASSTEGNYVNAAPNQLAFRAALGGELYTSSLSIHPKVSGVGITSSFSGTSTFNFNSTAVFIPNTEVVFYDQPVAGIKNAVSNKIKVGSTDLYGTVLSGLNTLQQNYTVSQSYTRDVNYLEVGFSPQNEINEDINSQIGYFNIGEYIGDPRDISSNSYRYPALDELSLDYFKKYTSSYDFNDYLRLIKFFDNSLFKLIKDFIPARTGAATGAIVKQHLLERNRQRPAQVDYSQPEYTGSVTSLPRDYQTGSIEVFTGGAGGSVNVLTNLTQSWSSSILTKAGLVTEIESSQYEFFNGEFSGSSIDVIKGKLQDNPLLGSAYSVGIPDLQNLDVRSAAFVISASILDPITITYYNSGSYPFNNLQKSISYYNTTSYEYKPNFSVQADININITGSISGSGPFYSNFLTTNLVKDGVEILTDLLTLGSPSNFTHSISYPNLYLVSGSTYQVTYRLNALTPDTSASINANTSWTATVDNLYAQSTYYLDPTVYTQQNFPGNINNFSDYNSLLNNVYSNRVSDKYYDVDYSSNLLTPINFTSIISQSALYAQVQDSNYSSGSAWAKGRYSGTKLTSATYNTYTPGDISYGKTAVIDSYKTYFLYFSKIILTQSGSGDGTIYSGGNVKGVALIGLAGDSISLDSSNENIGLIQSLFPSGSSVTLISPLPILGTNLGPSTLSVIRGGSIEYPNFVVPGELIPDETNILIKSSVTGSGIFVDSPGYLIPQGYNPLYLQEVIKSAAAAGFPIN